jgi:hypothetical protein
MRVSTRITIAVVALFGLGRGAYATAFHSGMVGIVHGQTARLNVVDVADGRGDGACRVHLALYDATGAMVADAEAEVGPGQAAFLDLPLSPMPMRTRLGVPMVPPMLPHERMQLRGVVMKMDMDACADAHLLGTLEVFDRTGKTMVLHPPNELPTR